MNPRVVPPSDLVAQQAARHLGALAVPRGALGRLEDLAVWFASTQGEWPVPPLDCVRAVVFAGDHGVARDGVSAYPASVTEAMVRTMLTGRAVVSSLARQHGVAMRVLDVGVDAALDDVADDVTAFKVRRSSGSIQVMDALTESELDHAIEVGVAVAGEEIAAGAQLLVTGDMGIGNTTVCAALVGATLGLPASVVVGRGTGVGDDALAHKTSVIQQALDRVGHVAGEPEVCLRRLGSADIAAQVGFLVAAAGAGVPVLLDGVVSVTAALLAERLTPGAAAWFAAGHRSPEPAQQLALADLGLDPLIDLGLRVGEGSGALAALPIIRSASLLLSEVALLQEVMP